MTQEQIDRVCAALGASVDQAAANNEQLSLIRKRLDHVRSYALVCAIAALPFCVATCIGLLILAMMAVGAATGM